jgi:hypothetical protein
VQHPVKHLGFAKAAVEARAELRQVAGQVFLAHPMMDAADIETVAKYNLKPG